MGFFVEGGHFGVLARRPHRPRRSYRSLRASACYGGKVLEKRLTQADCSNVRVCGLSLETNPDLVNRLDNITLTIAVDDAET